MESANILFLINYCSKKPKIEWQNQIKKTGRKAMVIEITIF